MTEKRFKLVDIGFVYDNDELIGMEEIVDLLNELDEKYVDEFSLRETLQQELQRVEEENEQIRNKKERYKRLSEIRQQQINNRILTIKEFINNCSDNKVRSVLKELFYSEVNEYDLSSENRKLLNENEQLKEQLKELQDFKDNYDKNMELIHNSEYVQDFLNGNL